MHQILSFFFITRILVIISVSTCISFPLFHLPYYAILYYAYQFRFLFIHFFNAYQFSLRIQSSVKTHQILFLYFSHHFGEHIHYFFVVSFTLLCFFILCIPVQIFFHLQLVSSHYFNY